MEKNNMIAGFVMVSADLLVIFLAYLIRYKKKVNIISGYDENSVRDKDGLANWVGGTLLVMGLVALVPSIALILVNGSLMPLFVAAFILIILTGTFVAAIGGNKFKIK